MTAYNQKPKQLIDVGTKGNANTGDIIYDGGVKLNQNLDALYNTFGDIRLYDTGGQGVGTQYLHATGYYQKLPVSYYGQKAVAPGSMHDLDTTTQTFVVNLPNPKRGEMVRFINSNGSFSINPIMFKPQAGASIEGLNELRVNQGHVIVTFTCVDDSPNLAVWRYEISPMFGDFSVPVNKTIEIDASTTTNVTLFPKENYLGVKLLMSGIEAKVGQTNKTVSEALIMIDLTESKVFSDEYSILSNVDDKLYTVTFSVLNNNINAGVTNNSSGKIKFSIKSIETIKG